MKTKANHLFTVRNMTQIGILSAVAVVLMFFEIPLFFAPAFYKIDLSEIPVLVGSFSMGPLAGVVIEAIKILLKLLIKGSTTGGVGDLGNFLVGCAYFLPAALVYKHHKNKKGALVGTALGTALLTVLGCFMNAFVLLPVYAKVYGMPMEALIAMGTAVNPSITGLTTFVLLAVAPFNLLKGVITSILSLLLYRHIRPILTKK